MLLQPEKQWIECQVPVRIHHIRRGYADKWSSGIFSRPRDALVDVRASNKRDLLQELASRAAAALDLPADRICGELLKREELGSTGTGGGVAIPPARMSAIKKPFGMLVPLKPPIKFN